MSFQMSLKEDLSALALSDKRRFGNLERRLWNGGWTSSDMSNVSEVVIHRSGRIAFCNNLSVMQNYDAIAELNNMVHAVRHDNND